MNIILTESQYSRLLNEETGGLDLFVDQMVNRFPHLDDYRDVIKKNIEDSGCQNISFEPMTFSSGLALHNKVLINDKLLGNGNFSFKPSISNLLYVVFHEIAHQHQYKKYSKELIYDIYTGELEAEGAVKFLKYIENVADQFSMRKCRELQKLGAIPENEKVVEVGGYDNYTDKMFIDYLNMIKKKIQKAGITDPEDISEFIYNMIKPKL